MLSKCVDNNVKTFRYDPAIPGIDRIPTDKIDFIINTDVLEHIPIEHLDETLKDIASLSSSVFFNISLRLAHEILPNGENAHCTVYPADWWKNKLEKHFKNVNLIAGGKDDATFITFNLDNGIPIPEPAPNTTLDKIKHIKDKINDKAKLGCFNRLKSRILRMFLRRIANYVR
jgi:hypothetical protein